VYVSHSGVHLFCCNICNFSRYLGVMCSAPKKMTVLVLGREGVTNSFLTFRSPSTILITSEEHVK